MKTKEEQLIEVLNYLIHACEDQIDDYTTIYHYCKIGKNLIPNFSKEEIFTEYSKDHEGNKLLAFHSYDFFDRNPFAEYIYRERTRHAEGGV